MGVGFIPRRIAFINEKGGSGKTTLVANIAAHLASRLSHRTLAIDMDPQGQLGKVLGVEVRPARRSAIALLVDGALGDPADPANEGECEAPQPMALPVLATRIPKLDIIVANKSLALFPGWAARDPGGELGNSPDPTERLARRLARAPELEAYDYVLIDAPPSFGPLTLNILRACEEVVVPVPLTYLALDGCAELLRTLELVRTRYGNEDLRVTMVVPTFYRRTRLAGEILERLRQRFPTELAATVVGFHVKIDEAQSRGLSIFEYAPRDKGAQAMAALAEELERRGSRAVEAGAGAEAAPQPARPAALPESDAALSKTDATLPKADATLPKADATLPKADATLPAAEAARGPAPGERLH